MTGIRVEMGPTAVLAIGDPAVLVVVTSYAEAPNRSGGLHVQRHRSRLNPRARAEG